MTIEKRRLDAVVKDFVFSLTSDETRTLSALILNHQVQESWPWYLDVMSRYLQDSKAQELILEIEEIFPDESALRLIEASSDMPVFEAKVILRASQDFLRAKTTR